jgi:hypothetical protein
MNRGILLTVLVAVCALGNAACSGGNSSTPPPVVTSQNFTFSVTGVALDNLNGDGLDPDPYDIVGVVSIAADGSGTVTGGIQDYSDGDRIASPQPQGDAIMSGSLALNADGSGNGTLTLVTNNPQVGVSGTEMFAVSFSNTDHALITQFDGSATSSGSIDLQTSTAMPAGAFSFVVSGLADAGGPVVYGGVFTVDSSGNIIGMTDSIQGGMPFLEVPVPAGAALSATDSFGRGSVTTDSIFFGTINYYVVSPKVFRLVQTELAGQSSGSAYSQGANPSFTNASIGASVFSLGYDVDFYAAAGQFTTDVAPSAKPRSNPVVPEVAPIPTNNFSGVGDLNELDGDLLPAATIGGTYFVGTNGFGRMLFNAGFGTVLNLGIYAVDPTLNILDPNNTTGGGGAVLAEIDTNHIGAGVLIPQTDTNAAHFTGDYTFGAQGASDVRFDEFDFLGQATVTAGAFAGTGFLSDPFVSGLTGKAMEFPNVNFASTAEPDGSNPGRFTFSPFVLSSSGFANPIDLTFTAYQANAGQLFLVGIDSTTVFGGSIEQNTLAGAVPGKQPKPTNQKP